jgi:hypothetical protein
MVVVVWWMGSGKVVAAGLEDGTLTISKVLLSTPEFVTLPQEFTNRSFY